MHLNGNFLYFLETAEAKVIILTQCVKHNDTMAINKFQMSRLAFDLLAKVIHIGIPSIYYNCFLRNHQAN